MEGWQSLGALMGGLDRETPRLEGRRIGAQTENALAQARVRRIEEAKKMDELKNMQNVQEGLVNAFNLDANTAGGYATMLRGGVDPRQMTGALETQQTMGFRDRMSDPTTPFPDAQRLRMAAGDTAFNPTSVQGGLAFDLFAPDPYASGVTTPGEDALIRQRNAAAALSDEKRTNPGAFRPSFNMGGLGADLMGGDENLPPSTLPADVDFTQGAGAPGFFRGVGNTLADVVGGNLPFPEAQDAIQALDNLSTRTMIMMQESVPGRPSQFLMERLQSLALQPGDFRAGSEIGKRKVNQTLSLLEGELHRMQRLAGSGVETKANRDALRSGLASTQQLIADYRMLAESFNAQAPEDDGTPPPEGVDPTAWSNMTPEEKARVMELLGGQQ